MTAIALLLFPATTINAAPTPSFMGLGTTSTCRFPTLAAGVSADGSVVVGRCQNNTGNGAFEAFRWTESTGLVTLGDLPGGGYSSQSLGVSADGSVIAGTGRSSESGNSNVATRWTQNSGWVSLGVLPGGQYSSSASTISDDGSVIVGFSSSSLNDQAYRWTAQEGMVGLGASRSYARGVSADGSVIVGEVGSLIRPFRWTAQSGLVNLGLPPGGANVASAQDVSNDGNTIVGYGVKPSGDPYAFLWREGSGFQNLGPLLGDTISLAREVSGDGSRVVGYSRRADFRAVLWDGANGIRDLREWLVNDFSLNLTGWLLTDAYAISSDGDTIVGVGTNPQGEQEAFRAVIPEPATVFLLLAAGLFARSRQRRWNVGAPITALSLLLFSAAPTSAAPTPSFMGLGTTSTCRFPTVAFGVSADGSTVVGRCQNNTGTGQFIAFRWTASTGLVTLGDLPGGEFTSAALGVSSDGSVVVGRGASAASGGNGEAFRWTAQTGLVPLGDLPGGLYSSAAGGVSADGSVIVGFSSTDTNEQAFRWTAQGGMMGLGGTRSFARDVSADGSVVVGDVGSLVRPFRWTEQSGLVNLGLPPGGANQASAQDVSSDGSTITGYGTKPTGDVQAFVWHEESGFQNLGMLPGDTMSLANSISGDGNRIVGYSRRADFRAVLWDGANGIRDMRQMLIDDFGLNMNGWLLDTANAISTDGTTIVGVGINPQGEQEAFRAVIPEPATVFLLLAAGLFVRGLRSPRTRIDFYERQNK